MLMNMTARRTVAFTEPQMEYLEIESKRLGISVADVVRRIVDSYRGANGK